EKFPPGKLAEYLRAPSAHYEWTRMPDFHLSADEAKQLEEFLFAAAPKPEIKSAPTDAAILEKGNKLVQSSACMNYPPPKLKHPSVPQKPEPLHSRHVKARRKLPASDCLGANPFAAYSSPAEEKAALEAFTLAGFDSPARHAPAEFAERQTRL